MDYLLKGMLIGPAMIEKECVTEELKAADQMKWVQMRNNIQHRAEKFILRDYIYV